MSERLVPEMADTDGLESTTYLDEKWIEELWHDLGEQVSQEQIRKIASEAAVEFQDATVTSFLSIFIRRRILEKLSSLRSQSEGMTV